MKADAPIYVDTVIAQGNHRLFWIAYIAMTLLVAQSASSIVKAWQPPQPPYVLEVNERGEPIGKVLPILSVQAIPDGMLKAGLGDFIHDAFTGSQDQDEESLIFKRTQSRVTGTAFKTLDNWYQRDNGKHDPRHASRYNWTEALTQDVLKTGTDRYQVDYKLITHTDNDPDGSVTSWRANLHVIVGRSKDPESLGWFVDELDFQQVG